MIIDEAHNIENVCRDIASKSFRIDYIIQAIDDCELVGGISNDARFNYYGVNLDKKYIYENIVVYLEKIVQFIRIQYLEETVNF